MKKRHSRRYFMKYSALAGVGLCLNPLALFASNSQIDLNQPPHKHVNMKGKSVITILQTTDVHCQIHAHDEMFWEGGQKVFRKTGGYAQLAALFNKIKKENPNTFIVDTGDMFQGSQLSVETTGQALQPILNAMSYNLYLPGNWEVVYYKDTMLKLLGGLDAPTVCANMFHDVGNGKKGDLIFKPYKVWSAGDVKIGFVGYTDPLVPIRQSPAYSKGIIYTQPEENLQHYVHELREKENCAYVILLSHLGLSQQIALGNSEACKGVDYIFGGDTHERVRKPIQCKYTKVVEPGAFGSFIGRLDLVVEGGKIVSDHYALLEVEATKLEPDPMVQKVIEKVEGPLIKEINNVVGYSTVPLYRYFVVENTIDTLIIDALKWKVQTDIVLSNGFRFCPPRIEKDATGNIPISEGFVYDMLPVNSQVRTGKVNGKQIQEWLEKELNNVFAKEASNRLGGWVVKFKGMKIKFKAYEEKGKRVQSIEINGEALQPQKEYTVCACEREGDPVNTLCRMENVKEAKNTPYSLHDIVKGYLKVHSPVTPLPENNAIILDAPSTLLTQVTGVDYDFT